MKVVKDALDKYDDDRTVLRHAAKRLLQEEYLINYIMFRIIDKEIYESVFVDQQDTNAAIDKFIRTRALVKAISDIMDEIKNIANSDTLENYQSGLEQ